MLLETKIALITGCSRGIGAAIAKAFAEQGSAVIVNYLNPLEPIDEVLKEVKSYRKESKKIRFDVSKKNEVQMAIY